MAVIYVVSEGRPEREGILAEVPLERCIDTLGLDPSQRVYGLREGGAPFGHQELAGRAADERHLVVAAVGPEEAAAGFEPGPYWLDLAPAEVRRRLELT